MERFCFALDLVDDEELIAEYEHWHKTENGWLEIKKSILDAHITVMEIYRISNRLFMIMEVSELYSAEQKEKMDTENPKVQEWEQLMWKFQQPLPWAKPGEKWLPMKQIFKLQ